MAVKDALDFDETVEFNGTTASELNAFLEGEKSGTRGSDGSRTGHWMRRLTCRLMYGLAEQTQH